MAKRPDEDLFQDSTMTFGEHLEELRACLIKSLLALAIGVGIGMLFGKQVVALIQLPLREALIEHYKAVKKAELVPQVEARFRELAGHDVTVDGAAEEERSDSAVHLIEDENLIYERVYVRASQWLQELQEAFPDRADQFQVPLNPEGHPPSTLGPTSVVAADLLDSRALCRSLVQASADNDETAAVAQLFTLLSEADRQVVQDLAQGEGTLTAEQQEALVQALNRLLERNPLYVPKPLADLALSRQAQLLMKQVGGLSNSERRRLNRLVLEAAFPETMARTYAEMIPLVLWRPVETDPKVQPVALAFSESFIIWIKASLLAGALISSPAVFYFLWSFVAAGLYPHEKHYIHIFLPISLGLFLSGAALAFFFVFKPVLSFLLTYNASLGIDPMPRISEWLTFVMLMPLGFGISFQLPLVMLFFERIGVMTVDAYTSKWRIAILVIAFLSMVLTPAEPISMMMMLVPLSILYFGGILLCYYLPRRTSPFAETAASV